MNPVDEAVERLAREWAEEKARDLLLGDEVRPHFAGLLPRPRNPYRVVARQASR